MFCALNPIELLPVTIMFVSICAKNSRFTLKQCCVFKNSAVYQFVNCVYYTLNTIHSITITSKRDEAHIVYLKEQYAILAVSVLILFCFTNQLVNKMFVKFCIYLIQYVFYVIVWLKSFRKTVVICFARPRSFSIACLRICAFLVLRNKKPCQEEIRLPRLSHLFKQIVCNNFYQMYLTKYPYQSVFRYPFTINVN